MCAPFGGYGNAFASLSRGLFVLFCCVFGISYAQVSNDRVMSVQGRVTVDDVAFNNFGLFKFALIEGLNGQVLWTHDGTSNGLDSQPTSSIELSVRRGVYSILLGDSTVPNMTNPLNAGIFDRIDVRVRVWFNDKTNGFQRLLPDQRLSSVAFSFNAERAREAEVYNGVVTMSQIPANVITNNSTNVTFTGTFTGSGAGLVGIRGSTPFQVVTGTNLTLVPNTGYLVTNTVETSLLLPTNAALTLGDIIRVSGPNAGSWKIKQNDGQSIVSSGFAGTIGADWVARDSVRLWADVASSDDGTVLMAGVVGGTGANPLYVSTNSGVNWVVPNPVTLPQRNWRTFASSADGSRWVAGTDNSTLFITSDFGQTWSSKSTARLWTGVTASADGSNMVAVAMNNFLANSIDGGEIWTNRGGTSRNYTGVTSSKDGVHAYATATGDRIYVSRDRGITWAAIGPSPRAWTGIASSANGQRLVAIANNAQIATSSNYGTNWVDRPGPGVRTWTAVASSADGLKLAATFSNGAGGIYTSIDGGENWTLQSQTGNIVSVTSSADGRKLAIAISNGRIYTSAAEPVKSTTVGTAGYLQGDEASAIELQYFGNGRFFPLSSSGTIYAN